MLIIQSIALIQSSRLQFNSLVYHSLSQIKFFSLFQLVCQSNSLHFSSLSTNPTFCFYQSSLPIHFFALFQHVFQSTLFSVTVCLPIHSFLCYSLSSNPLFSLLQSVFQSTLFSRSVTVCLPIHPFSVPVCLPVHHFLCPSQSSDPSISLFQSVYQSTLFFVPVSLPIHPFFFSSQSSNPPFSLLKSFSLPKPISLFLYIFDLFRHFCWCQICLLYIPSFFIYIYQALLLAVFHLYLCRV